MKLLEIIKATLLRTAAEDVTPRTFEHLDHLVTDWADDRMIIPRSTPMAQSVKTMEEVCELQKAILGDNRLEMKDAYGDALVTLIIGARLAGLNPVECLDAAYESIKNRKGYLNIDGIFVKEGDDV